jgi:hypothetical protein
MLTKFHKDSPMLLTLVWNGWEVVTLNTFTTLYVASKIRWLIESNGSPDYLARKPDDWLTEKRFDNKSCYYRAENVAFAFPGVV